LPFLLINYIYFKKNSRISNKKENKMFGIGMPELIIVLAIVFIIFGAGKLPEIGKGLGKGIRNFKKSFSEDDTVDDSPKQKEIDT
jgi:sec-independent protein translocase protein TatA